MLFDVTTLKMARKLGEENMKVFTPSTNLNNEVLDKSSSPSLPSAHVNNEDLDESSPPLPSTNVNNEDLKNQVPQFLPPSCHFVVNIKSFKKLRLK